ncbi:MAG: hypothetical protein A2X94_09890 [Bdellovibrionales bacterium GWB1_55_8]|nr:MAG: hypothetical protein A2X94_09890 [Bdellovibrionales bacterium GWB1_55_8]
MGNMSQLLRDENGQAVLEYLLMVAVAVTATGIMAMGFRRLLLSIWGEFTQKIVGASPNGPPDPRYRFR